MELAEILTELGKATEANRKKIKTQAKKIEELEGELWHVAAWRDHYESQSNKRGEAIGRMTNEIAELAQRAASAEKREALYHQRWRHAFALCLNLQAELSKVRNEAAVSPSEGWIEWGGGEMPVAFDTKVDYRKRNGGERRARMAGHLSWRHQESPGDIVAYRIPVDAKLRRMEESNEELSAEVEYLTEQPQVEKAYAAALRDYVRL
ncbi:MAG: hypothetical protein KDK04_21940, partial [Candidatus Competibacteraceae bacterium]|nr:hypothetical protein [Candidatus Competibacteraceae bacterium]